MVVHPSRAAILTGMYNHKNGVKTLGDTFDSRQPTVQKMMKENGYQTALIGKWHLGHGGHRDRKSTRLNSSHVSISYAVFCLKKKKKYVHTSTTTISTETEH